MLTQKTPRFRRFSHMLLSICAVLTLVFAVSVQVSAQDPTGRPQPKPPKRPVKPKDPPKTPDAVTVTLTVLAPGASQVLVNGEERGTTNADGKLQITKLAQGHYSVEVRKEGFNPATQAFEAGTQSPTLVFKLEESLDADVKQFNSLLETDKLIGPETPNAVDLLNQLAAAHPDRPEVGHMREALFAKVTERVNTEAAKPIVGWRKVPREWIERSQLWAATASAMKPDDQKVAAQAAYLAGVLALRDYETRADDKDNAGLEQARVNLEKAVKLQDSWAFARYQLGRTLVDSGKSGDAEAAFIKASQLEPKWAPPHAALGLLNYASRKYKESLAEYQKAVELDPNYSAAYSGMALALAQAGKGDSAAAIKEILRAIELEPESGLPHYNLGVIYSQSKKPKDIARAEEELKQAIQKNQGNLDFRNSSAEQMLADMTKKKKK